MSAVHWSPIGNDYLLSFIPTLTLPDSSPLMNANDSSIVKLLVSRGRVLFDGPPSLVEFTKQAEADRFLNRLDTHPHAFVLGTVMDRQMKAERAWMIPYLIAEKLGGFEFERLVELSIDDVVDLMKSPEPLHRFPDEMSKNFHAAVMWIADHYNGNAAEIWNGSPSSAEVVYRFLKFRGVGPKLATMAANVLARDFKIPFSDYYSIDVSVDVQVRRVLFRLGLTSSSDDTQAIIYRARALYPEFPGLLDFPAWEIGRNWCRPKAMQCGQCLMRSVCPTAAALQH
jgi:endonuclease III